jgi:penicillin amidase
LVHFTKAVLTQAVGAALTDDLLGAGPVARFSANPFQKAGPELAIRWLETAAPDWVGSIRPLLLPALDKTLTTLQDQVGKHEKNWEWGKLHYAHIKHPLANIPLLGRLWRPQRLPLGGDGTTINQADVPPSFPPEPVQMVASCRFILDVDAWDNSVAVLPGGQSGSASSAHYLDGLRDWHNGRYHPMLFSDKRINAAVKWKIQLDPAN